MTETPMLAADLEGSYARAMSQYLHAGGEGPLHEAYELGRRGLAEKRGVLDMANLYHETLIRTLRQEPGSDLPLEILARAGEFFAESMSPFEMAHRAVEEANSALHRLNETLEEEARRIALALHDDAGQLMVAAHMRLDHAMQGLPPVAQEELRSVKTLLDSVDDRLRHLSHEVHPAMLNQLGLVAALKFLAASLMERSALHITVQSTLRGRTPQRLAIVFYRIVQEALTNIQRHAQASSVQIRIGNREKTLWCTVSDDGVGFDPKLVSRSGQHGLGLKGIQERITVLGGALQITSEPGRGAKLEITAPLQEGEYAVTHFARR